VFPTGVRAIKGVPRRTFLLDFQGGKKIQRKKSSGKGEFAKVSLSTIFGNICYVRIPGNERRVKGGPRSSPGLSIEVPTMGKGIPA